MKKKFVWVLLSSALCFFACNDNTGSLGIGMLPGGDKITVGTKTFDIKTKSVLAGPVFAKTNIGYIGRFTDSEFGRYESGFLTQLNCVDSLTFPEVYDRETKTGLMTGDSIYAAEVVLYYTSFFGDSLNPCRMSAYELDTPLEKYHYTDITPEDYYSPDGLLARKAYSAVDLSIPESTRYSSTFYPFIRIPIDKEVGERIFKANREHPEYFYDSKRFIENVFKGLYLKSDLGDGTVLYVDQVELNIAYPCFELDSLGDIVKTSQGVDSIIYLQRSFVSTREVIQANQVTSDKLEDKIESEKECTYLKSPAGIFTQMTLPVEEIAEELGRDTLNSAKLSFTTYVNKDEEAFSMSAPKYLLLIREKEYEAFFEENKLADNVSSYIAYYISDTNQYQFQFNNLSRLITTCINEKEDAKEEAGSSWNEAEWLAENENWDKVLLIPVTVKVDSNNTILSVHHDMAPAYIRLKGGEADTVPLELVITKFN
ncbi:DUF4270 domain-containing protein [Bacteroides sp. OttesenSCG-928-M17]|nr:DUF4270 domain-containing protein [Bacteroides sp. OttesenSCG-928-M17]